ncbi:probable E3 ubiquitin-protein ligase HIP1 isoform X2 [Phalaenopsis equestris]|uniref:probable E3 ubiquitin-protein ligase HIP1 isoform X2 n=1 Tax=Phalaenopsis equestris TaxID=78828 RepID=UPI0009E481F2|nr:probable E3 ubiquitin-protein ligase HIP1 isoform X2 [Phalaenopsis equestris]
MAMTPQEADVLGIWNSGDHNTNPFVAIQKNHDETERVHGRNVSLSINSGSSPRMEEMYCDRTNILENLDLNLNNSPVDDGQLLTQNPIHMSPEHYNVPAGFHGDDVETSLCASVPDLFEPECVLYPNSIVNSSSCVVKGSERHDRARKSVDVRRIPLKRKNMEELIGESSSNHNNAGDLSIPSSSRHLRIGSFSGGNQSPSFSSMHLGVSFECYPSSSSQRNLPEKINLDCQNDVSSSRSLSATSGNNLFSSLSPGEPSSSQNPIFHLAEQSQPYMLSVPGLPHHVHHSPANSGIGSSSSIGSSLVPAFIQRRMRLFGSQEEANVSSLPRNDINQLLQDPRNCNPSNSNLSMSGNGVSMSSGIIPSPASISELSETVLVQYPRNLSEHSSSASAQELGQSSGAVRQGDSPLHPRTAVLTERQRGFSALPLHDRSRDGRTRMLSEIRNALDLIRTNLHFEDVFIFNQSGFNGLADLNDRHRDMRLDVDDMSYEELLALEERIGYVNTGLCEQTILKFLKKRKYSPCELEAAASEQEPCCICREDYKEGEAIGTLNCRHDFHTDCIKQWLIIKNLCPICKTTALVEGGRTISDGTK